MASSSAARSTPLCPHEMTMSLDTVGCHVFPHAIRNIQRVGTIAPQSHCWTREMPRHVGRTRLREGWTMHLSGESLLVILLVGLVAGWLAGKIVQGSGFGLIGDMAIGIVGALIGSWLMPRLGIRIASGIVSSIIVATIGAVLLLAIARLATGAYPRRRWWRL